jgi:hypothetical protein
VPFYDVSSSDWSFESVGLRSKVLFWSMVAAGSHGVPEFTDVHERAFGEALEAARSTIYNADVTLDDLAGLAVYELWFADQDRSPSYSVIVARTLDLDAAGRRLDLHSTDDSSQPMDGSLRFAFRLYLLICYRDLVLA